MTDDPEKSIKDIKHELQKNFSKTPSINSILKERGYWYIAPQLSPKIDDKIRSKWLN